MIGWDGMGCNCGYGFNEDLQLGRRFADKQTADLLAVIDIAAEMLSSTVYDMHMQQGVPRGCAIVCVHVCA